MDVPHEKIRQQDGPNRPDLIVLDCKFVLANKSELQPYATIKPRMACTSLLVANR